MLNREKVIRMTRMASYEKRQGKKDKAAGNYFRRDYVGMQMLFSFFYITFFFAAVCGVYVLLNFETLLHQIYNMDLIPLGKKILTIYGITTVLYLAVTYCIYTVRHGKARKRLLRFYENLNRLDDSGEET